MHVLIKYLLLVYSRKFLKDYLTSIQKVGKQHTKFNTSFTVTNNW